MLLQRLGHPTLRRSNQSLISSTEYDQAWLSCCHCIPWQVALAQQHHPLVMVVLPLLRLPHIGRPCAGAILLRTCMQHLQLSSIRQKALL